MKKQILISFLIVAFFNYIIGCSVTKTERISPENLSFSKEIIEEAVLNNLDVIRFDENGGYYAKPDNKIVGKLEDGKKIEFPVDRIKEFRTSRVEPIKLEDLSNQKIKEVHLKNNMLVTFDADGGLYNKEENQIIGNTVGKIHATINIDKVANVFLEVPDKIDEYILSAETKLTQIILQNNNLLYVFDKDGGKYLSYSKDMIIGLTPDKQSVTIDPDSVLYLNVQRSDVAGSILATVGVVVLIVGVIGLIIAATKQSCPFIYSFDGNKYVFDAEPLGGATTKGLERTEYSKMDYLQKVDDSYKILVRNEVEETQFIDELSLLAIKHDEDKEVIPDLNGKFYQIKNPVTPVYAIDENGLDLKKAVNADDNLYWQTKLPIDSILVSQNQRHELTFSFPKPVNNKSAKLIANIGTSLWGSRMIREMLQLYGSSIDNYYEKIDEQGSEYKQLMNFIEKEELYKLKYYTKNGGDWKFQGFINGGGPLISETRVYDLDLSDIAGDSVTIKINPPFGFWTVDYLAIEYEEYEQPEVEILNLETAINQDGAELKETIRYKDNSYYEMPVVGDYFEAKYADTKNNFDLKTSFYLKSSGYYEIHLNKSLPLQLVTLGKLITNPGFIIKYSNDRYREWEKLNN